MHHAPLLSGDEDADASATTAACPQPPRDDSTGTAGAGTTIRSYRYDPFLGVGSAGAAPSQNEESSSPDRLEHRFVQGHWSQYFHITWERLQRNFSHEIAEVGDFDAVFCSDLPSASGMSSSSALVVAAYLMVAGGSTSSLTQALFQKGLLPSGGADERDDGAARRCETVLFTYLGCCENGSDLTVPGSGEVLVGDRGVGTFGGSEDHTAILGCRRGFVSHHAFAPARFLGDVAWPEGIARAMLPARELFGEQGPQGDRIFSIHIVVAASGVEAAKTVNKLAEYNDAVGLAKSARERVLQSGVKIAREEPPSYEEVFQAFIAHHEAALVGHGLQYLLPRASPTRGSEKLFCPFPASSTADLRPEKLFCSDVWPRTPNTTNPTHQDHAASTERFRVAEGLRFLQFGVELSCIREFSRAFHSSDFRNLDVVTRESQKWSEHGLQNIVEETKFLAESADELGAVAASAFGAGFGGSVYALVAVPVGGPRLDETSGVESSICPEIAPTLSERFREKWLARYTERFPQWAERCDFFVVEGPCCAAGRIL